MSTRLSRNSNARLESIHWEKRPESERNSRGFAMAIIPSKPLMMEKVNAKAYQVGAKSIG